MHEQESNTGQSTIAAEAAIASRRALLRLGAVGAVTVVTIRPGIAQAASSVLTCKIPVPDPAHGGMYIAADGTLVAAGTVGAFAPPGRDLGGDEVRLAIAGTPIPGCDPAASAAWVKYVQRLQAGQGGFTCYASLQMPR